MKVFGAAPPIEVVAAVGTLETLTVPVTAFPAAVVPVVVPITVGVAAGAIGVVIEPPNNAPPVKLAPAAVTPDALPKATGVPPNAVVKPGPASAVAPTPPAPKSPAVVPAAPVAPNKPAFKVAPKAAGLVKEAARALPKVAPPPAAPATAAAPTPVAINAPITAIRTNLFFKSIMI